MTTLHQTKMISTLMLLGALSSAPALADNSTAPTQEEVKAAQQTCARNLGPTAGNLQNRAAMQALAMRLNDCVKQALANRS